MRNLISRLTVLLIFSSTYAISNDRDTPRLASWPFFQNAQTPHSIIGGYGDWSVIDEGPQPGLDFTAQMGEATHTGKASNAFWEWLLRLSVLQKPQNRPTC